MRCSYLEPTIVLRFIGPRLKITRVCFHLMVGQEVVLRDLLPFFIVVFVLLVIFFSDILVRFLTDVKINILTFVGDNRSPFLLNVLLVGKLITETLQIAFR